MAKVKLVKARQILDSRGNPTIEVDLTLSDGSFGRAAVPSGASTGSHEAIELRDGGKRWKGLGVEKAVKNVNEKIQAAIKNKEWDQESLDTKMIDLDGTPNKAKFGANAILGVSMAFAKATAKSQKKSLHAYFNKLMPKKTEMTMPIPMMNLLNGGKHAENSADIQEFMIVPHGFTSFSKALEAGADIFHTLKKLLSERNLGTTVGDEGGFAPALESNEAALAILVEAIEKAGYNPGKQVSLAMDVAATELYKEGKYELARDKRSMSTEEMVNWYKDLVSRYPIVSIEDGLAEDDWEGYKLLTETIGDTVQLVGDDLFVTNISRLAMGIEKKAGNSILIKLNQIGTVSETIDAISLARTANFTSIISHRSGETEDTTIADFAVGTGVGLIKTGSASRTDRVAKYNQLVRIEEEMKGKVGYPKLKSLRSK